MGERILGIDLGIASCGWGIIEKDRTNGRIIGAGVWEWDSPESPDKKKSNLSERGAVRRRRRLLHVRRERMRKVKELLVEFAAIKRASRNALSISGLNPWRLRIAALDRKLESEEWSVVLGHLAGHRAYLSNAKRKKNEPDDDTKKLLKALTENEREFEKARAEGIARTIGEWLAIKDKQRNRGGEFRHSIKREWIRQEAATIFERQRKFENPLAFTSLENRYFPLAFEQGQITAPPVSDCTFEPSEKRAAKHSYSFERFRLLQRLTNVRIVANTSEPPRRLTESEIRLIESKLGVQPTISYKTLRKALGLSSGESFLRINDAEQEEQDIVTNTKSGQSAPGTRALRTVIIRNFKESEWKSMLAKPAFVDAIASAIAHRDDLELIRAELKKVEVKPEIVETLLKESDGGELGFFKGTGHLSTKALNKLIPHMLEGLDYHDAQIAAKYDPSMDRYSRRPGIVGSGPNAVATWLKKDQLEELIRNQVVARAIRETFKQVLSLWRAEGPFDAIHLEMAREVGKNAAERDEMDRENKRRRDRRNALRESFIDNFRKKPTDREFERWTLWTEQQGKCPYTPYNYAGIPCDAVLDGDERVEVDHPLPRSRFNLESLDNKVLCLTGANRNKRNQTPYEWLSKGQEKLNWESFCEQAKIIFLARQRKLNNLLIVDTTKLEKSLSSRALNDTRWISKFLLAGFERLGTKDQPLRVQPVNAALVASLRWAWGLAGWKHDPKDRSKRQSDDRHHALDAMIVATIDAKLVHRLTGAYQRAEERGEYFEARCFKPPWKGFREELLGRLYGDGAAQARPNEFTPDSTTGVLVSRSERRRARGQMHKETTYRLTKVVSEDTGVLKQYRVVRTTVNEKLNLADLERLKDPDRNHKLLELLRDWIKKGNPTDDLPVWKYSMPDGSIRFEPIRAVSLIANEGPAVVPRRLRKIEQDNEVAFATYDRIEMVRIDVYENSNAAAKARYSYVPIYVHQIVEATPPNRAFTLRRPYEEWPAVAGDDKFLYSIYKFSLMQVEADGKLPLLGYFRGLDSNDGRLKFTPQYSRDEKLAIRYSPTTVTAIQKFTVDRLGCRHRVTREVRTWRGKACT